MKKQTKQTNTEVTETLEQFSERMSGVDKTNEYQVGRAYQGNSRATYIFEGQYVYLESIGYRTIPQTRLGSKFHPVMSAFFILAKEPFDYWWTDYMTCGKSHAEKIAKYYNAKISETPYAEVDNLWFHYSQMQWDDLMRFCYDRHTGKFDEMFGVENNVYKSCI